MLVKMAAANISFFIKLPLLVYAFKINVKLGYSVIKSHIVFDITHQ
ncbi:MAG: hypothetical protein ACP5UF_05195 [Hydrogenobaculum sp.]